MLYHPGQRDIEHAVIPWCEAHGAAVVAYSPFGHDSFPGPRSPGGRVLAEIARAHGATPRQVALAFLVRRPNVFAIPKAASLAHVEENAGAGECNSRRTRSRGSIEAFPLGRPLRSLPML